MLTVFATELNSTQSELETLLAKVDALRGQMKSLKATESKVLKVMDNLKLLVSELPEMALAELKKEILSLFPNEPIEPTKEPITEEPKQLPLFQDFVTEVPKIEKIPPQAKRFLIIKDEIAPVKEEAIASQPDLATEEDDQWPEIETAISKIEVSELCFYLRQPNQEIVAAYFAVANKNIGKEWADYLNLMGCIAEVRKAEKFDNGVRWEVEATQITRELILQINRHRSSLYSSVPAGNSEYTKKSTTGQEKTGENLDDSKTPALQSNSQPESLEIITEKVLVAN